MTNSHLPSQVAWVAYKHQLWSGLQYGHCTMTNDTDPANQFLNNSKNKTLNILGVLHYVTKGLRKLHTTFGGFGLFNLPTKQLIS